MGKLVIALGGNALQMGNSVSAADQLQACRHTARSIADLIRQGHNIAIVHGNGPQVGEIVADIELAHKVDNKHPIFPFDVCGAFTQGYIGYHLQNAIGTEIKKVSLDRRVLSIITQVEVDSNDPAFNNPTKPIGSFFTAEEAKKLMSDSAYTMKEDAGRGWRRVVASPKPLDIIEKEVIRKLYQEGDIVICCGGGGIPIRKVNGELHGVEAVIDKDFAAAKLAEIVAADMFIILTAVEKVAINFNKPNQQNLSEMTVSEAEKHIADNQFAPGSMLPKILAAVTFLQKNPKGKVLITSLERAAAGLNGEAGTILTA